jgi:N-methylhydantoinase B
LGVFGGKPGHKGRTYVFHGDGSKEEIGRIKVLTLRRGDRLVMESSSAGGFGDPFECDPVLVLRDVLDGFLRRKSRRPPMAT